MPQTVFGSLTVELPDTPQEMAKALSFIANAWSQMLDQITSKDMTGQNEQLEPTSRFVVNETRLPRTRGTKAGNSGKGGRKAREQTKDQEVPNADP